ncbi:MAG: DMT family transporter [Candidatus Micrarchaeota archaeon]
MGPDTSSFAFAGWQLAAIGALIFLAAYGIAVKGFFNANHDWRAFIPMVFFAGIVLGAYYLYSSAYSEVSNEAYVFALGLGVIFALSTVFSFIAMKGGPISVVVPLFSLNLVLVVIAGALLYREEMTAYKIAGVVLGLISIILLTIEKK